MQLSNVLSQPKRPVQSKTVMTFSLIEYLECVLRWFPDRSFSCTQFLLPLVDSQIENVPQNRIW